MYTTRSLYIKGTQCLLKQAAALTQQLLYYARNTFVQDRRQDARQPFTPRNKCLRHLNLKQQSLWMLQTPSTHLTARMPSGTSNTTAPPSPPLTLFKKMYRCTMMEKCCSPKTAPRKVILSLWRCMPSESSLSSTVRKENQWKQVWHADDATAAANLTIKSLQRKAKSEAHTIRQQ